MKHTIDRDPYEMREKKEQILVWSWQACINGWFHLSFLCGKYVPLEKKWKRIQKEIEMPAFHNGSIERVDELHLVKFWFCGWMMCKLPSGRFRSDARVWPCRYGPTCMWCVQLGCRAAAAVERRRRDAAAVAVVGAAASPPFHPPLLEAKVWTRSTTIAALYVL
jgi:hypothetical protein